jgi:hypothetical protein
MVNHKHIGSGWLACNQCPKVNVFSSLDKSNKFYYLNPTRWTLATSKYYISYNESSSENECYTVNIEDLNNHYFVGFLKLEEDLYLKEDLEINAIIETHLIFN